MNDFLQNCLGAAAVIASAFYGYGLWKDRKNSNKIDTVKLFKDQIDGMELKMKTQEADIIKLTTEVQKLRAEIETKDKKLAELLNLLQGRDPAMQEVISSFKEYMAIGKPAIIFITTDLVPLAKRLEKFLDKQSF